MSTPNRALAILTWKGGSKLEASLKTYADNGLFALFDEVILFAQEPSETDQQLASHYDLKLITTDTNIGIFAAWEKIVHSTDCEQILMLEYDCPCVEAQAKVVEQINLASDLLSNREANIVRLRSIKQPGAKFYNVEKYSRYFLTESEDNQPMQRAIRTLRRVVRPTKARRLLGSAIYAHTHPEKVHNEIGLSAQGIPLVRSANLNWTNQSIMFERQWFIDRIIPRVRDFPANRTINGFQDIEMALNCPWWRQQNFIIAAPQGLFSHFE